MTNIQSQFLDPTMTQFLGSLLRTHFQQGSYLLQISDHLISLDIIISSCYMSTQSTFHKNLLGSLTQYPIYLMFLFSNFPTINLSILLCFVTINFCFFLLCSEMSQLLSPSTNTTNTNFSHAQTVTVITRSLELLRIIVSFLSYDSMTNVLYLLGHSHPLVWMLKVQTSELFLKFS